MHAVRDFLQDAMVSQNSFTIYRSVEEDEAELHVEDTPGAMRKPVSRTSKLWDLPTWQKIAIAVIVTASIAFILGFLATRRPCAACVTDGDQNEEIPEDFLEQETLTMDW
ncbi:unnamed protein product, partial [Staurois parvus]